MSRWPAALSLALLALTAPALARTGPPKLVSKHFLTKVASRLAVAPSEPLVGFPHYSPAEKAFVDQLGRYSYGDIFRPVYADGRMIYSYRVPRIRDLDAPHVGPMTCEKVFTDDDGKTFVTTSWLVSPWVPSGLNRKKAWWFSYCAGRDTMARDDSVLYFFHGASGNPKNWLKRRSLVEVRNQWRLKELLPQWASISMGHFGVMGTEDYQRRFMKVVVPYVEKKLGFGGPDGRQPKHRFGLGVSMGGYNLSYLLLHEPQFFEAGFLVCPAMAVPDGTSSTRAWDAYRSRTGAIWSLISGANWMQSADYKDPTKLPKVDPLLLGQRKLGPKSPPMYIQASHRDEFGFWEGNRLFAMLARARGASVKFDLLKGGHCVMTPHKVVSFFRKHRRQPE